MLSIQNQTFYEYVVRHYMTSPSSCPSKSELWGPQEKELLNAILPEPPVNQHKNYSNKLDKT